MTAAVALLISPIVTGISSNDLITNINSYDFSMFRVSLSDNLLKQSLFTLASLLMCSARGRVDDF